jgi:hypothetical protein
MDEDDGGQFVGIDLHRQSSAIVRQSESRIPSPTQPPADPAADSPLKELDA